MGWESPIGFCDDENTAACEAAGYVKKIRLIEWTFHRSLGQDWHNLLQSMFERLVKRSETE
jgi:hypothetical protein